MTDTNDTVLTQPLGNTKTRGRSWCLTLNNWNQDEYDTIKKWCDTVTQYIIGKEVGENGTPHLQIYVYNKNAIYFDKIKKIAPRAHIEKARGTLEENLKYCSKENNYITNIEEEEKQIDPLEGKELYPWQIDIINILNKPKDENNRDIYWFYERTGNVGKSAFVKSWVINHPDKCIVLSGNARDIKCGVAFHIKMKKRLDVAFFHLARGEQVDYIGIENVKDGLFFSGKYESGMVCFNRPHVVCFANFPPVVDRMSLDRWIITEL